VPTVAPRLSCLFVAYCGCRRRLFSRPNLEAISARLMTPSPRYHEPAPFELPISCGVNRKVSGACIHGALASEEEALPVFARLNYSRTLQGSIALLVRRTYDDPADLNRIASTSLHSLIEQILKLAV